MSGTGFFGGRNLNLIEEPTKSKLNILQEYKDVLEGRPMSEEALVPLLNWFSNTRSNIIKMQDINRMFFYCGKKTLCNGIFLNVNRTVRFIKYPKKPKNEEELVFLIPYICRYYGWSEREYEFYSHLINLEDEELHLELDRQFAFDKSECRKLGIKREKIKKKYEGKPKVVGFF